MGFVIFSDRAACPSWWPCRRRACGARKRRCSKNSARKIYEEAIVDGMYEQVRVRPNKALHACRFLFTTAVLMSLASGFGAPVFCRDLLRG